MGLAQYGGSRPYVGAQYGQRFTNSGYELDVTAAMLPTPGIYTIYAKAHSDVSGAWDDDHPVGAVVFVDMPPQTLTVTVTATGQGTVTSSPAGINCSGPTSPGGTCAYAFPWATTVTLTTTVTTGSFAGWSGGVEPPAPCAGDGACVREMQHEDAVTATFSTRPPLLTTYYHIDALGSVRLVTDQARNVVAHHDYQPFGEDTQPIAGDPRRFTGKELDVETALTYFGARYYRNTLGRFGTVDPELNQDPAAIDPQRWNRYSYAANRPLVMTDPDGREAGYVYLPNGRMKSPYDSLVPTKTGMIGLAVVAVAATAGAGAEAAGVINAGRALIGSLLAWAGRSPREAQEAAQAIGELVTGAQLGPSALGAAREARVAALTGGRVAGDLLVSAPGLGRVAVDVIGGAGEFITVGGPAKAMNMSSLGDHLRLLKSAAESAGTRAQAYFQKGTPQSVLELARKWLGSENVFMFDLQ